MQQDTEITQAISFPVFREADDLMTEGQINRRVEKGNVRGFREIYF